SRPRKIANPVLTRAVSAHRLRPLCRLFYHSSGFSRVSEPWQAAILSSDLGYPLMRRHHGHKKKRPNRPEPRALALSSLLALALLAGCSTTPQEQASNTAAPPQHSQPSR